MPRVLYLDDLAVGRKFATGTVTLTLEGCKAFAAEFDPQPFHLDEAAARQSVFGRIAASGWYTASLTMRLLVDGEMTIAGGLIGLGGDITWPRPTYPGDTLRVETEVLAIRVSESKPDRGVVTARNQTLNQRGEPVQIAVVRMLVPRRPEA
ncbi:MAG TPA: MaoC family dehydratase [Gammaproteobacteria bacterium]